ncbi:MAG: PKD domain-containing protein [Acidobacteria bacterium]|nr:PKD domain-containing protein [Acidobacteriota bacterium]
MHANHSIPFVSRDSLPGESNQSGLRPGSPLGFAALLGLVLILFSLAGGPAVAAEPPQTPMLGPAALAPEEAQRLAASGHPLLAAVLELPAALAAEPLLAYAIADVTQEEAELLFANAEAAVYFPNRRIVRLLSRTRAESWQQPQLDASASLTATALVTPVASFEELRLRAQGEPEQTVLAFASRLDAELFGSQGGMVPPQYLAKIPSVDQSELPASTGRTLAAAKEATADVIYENFDGDVWSAWERYDTSGGLYTWGQKGCEARSGAFSVDATRGGSQGAFLSCDANHPPSVKTYMWTTVCEYSRPDQAWLDLYIHAAMSYGEGDYFAFYIEDSQRYGWGYEFWGNWNATGVWFRLIFNLRQWYAWGDLTLRDCNRLRFDFQSDSSNQEGFGLRVDDLTVTFGAGATVPGECAILASPLSGPAPLTVTFQAAGDTYASYDWYFDDGSTSDLRDPIHTYSAPGTYWVGLTGYSSSRSCSASVKVTVTPGACTYSISPTSASFEASGGSGNVQVTTSGTSCAWNASSNASWITLTGGTSGTGSGTVTYQVAANSGGQRTGTVTIAGQTFTVTQAAAACTYSISPTSASAPAAGGNGTVAVTASNSSCTWGASSNASWITLTGGTSGTGNGTVSYQVSANSGGQRTGTVTIAGQTFTVTQAAAACSPPAITRQPANATVATGQSATFTVEATGTAPLQYQWYAGDPTYSTLIPGATSSSYTTPPLSASQTYFVVVSNACGSLQSNVVTATVQASPYSRTYYLSGIARTPGVSPSFWYSDLAVLNPNTSAIGIRVSFFGNDVPTPVVTTVQSQQQMSWKDVLSSAFGLTANQSGVIVVEATGPASVTARTYSKVTDACTAKVRTDGQSYPGLEVSRAVSYGQVAFLPNLRSDDPYSTGSGFRTNVEAVNVSTTPIDVQWTFFSDSRANLGTVTRTGIQPNRRVGVTAALPGGQIAAFAEARVLTAGGKAIFFASVVDGTSTDPTTVEAVLP